MTSEERDYLLAQVALTGRDTTKLFTRQFTGDELKRALLPTHELSRPIDDLIATGEAVFEFIRQMKMQKSTKSAFNQLERQFNFYKNLILI